VAAVVRAAVANTRNLLFIRWIRSNLSLGAFLFGILSATGTCMWWVSDYQHRLEALEGESRDRKESVLADKIDRAERNERRIRLVNDLAAVNARIDNVTQRQNGADERQQSLSKLVIDAGPRWQANAAEISTIKISIGVLDAQMAYVGSFIRDNTGLVAHTAGRK